jgi:hypothetical protein
MAHQPSAARLLQTHTVGDCVGAGPQERPPCTHRLNMRESAFRRMAGTPRAFFYSVAASRCAFGGWWGYCAAAPTGRETPRIANGLLRPCLGHAPGPAPCFGVNGSRGRNIKIGPFSISTSGRPLSKSLQRRGSQNSTSAPGDAIWGAHRCNYIRGQFGGIFFATQYPRPPGAPPW